MTKDKKNSLDPQFDDSIFSREAIEVAINNASVDPVSNGNKGIFIAKTANVWMEDASKLPMPKMLFDEFFHEGEFSFLYGDTNVGKSILGIQIADSITTGKPITGFRLTAEKQGVIYLDGEMSCKMFEARYVNENGERYVFSNLFIRLEFNADADLPDNEKAYEDSMITQIEALVLSTGAKVLVVDNLTFLKNETEKAKDALPFVKRLKTLKVKFGLSILVLAHTPKRDQTKRIGINDLAGSKLLINAADSAFAIGESANDKGLRYIKQIKSRLTACNFDTKNVCICQVGKPENFLKFEFIGFGNEDEYLKHFSESDTTFRDEQIWKMHQSGKSYRDIAKDVNVSLGTVQRIINKMKKENKTGEPN